MAFMGRSRHAQRLNSTHYQAGAGTEIVNSKNEMIKIHHVLFNEVTLNVELGLENIMMW